MALYKEIELENGITTTYHRIGTINKITNKNNIIEIYSYVSKEKREEELEKINANYIVDHSYINKIYNENETIKDAYDYLKTTEKFKDAIDD